MLSVFAFEGHRHLRHPAFWVLALTFFATAAYAGSHNHALFGHLVSSTVNAPANVAIILGVASVSALVVWGTLFAGSVVEDTHSRLTPLLFSLPLTSRDYVGGKVLAAITAGWLLCLAAALGLFLGTLFPDRTPSDLAPATALPYVAGLFWLALPNLLFACALLLAFALFTRSTGSTYFGLIVLFLFHIVAAMAFQGDAQVLSRLLDPFGLRAFTDANAPLTLQDDKVWHLTVNGVFLANRLLWVTVSIALLGAATWGLRRERRPRSTKPVKDTAAPAPHAVPARAPRPSPLRQALAIARFHLTAAARSWVFLGALASGLLLLVFNTDTIEGIPTAALRSTPQLYLEELAGTFGTLLAIVLVFFAADITFAEAEGSAAHATGALPVPAWVWRVGKGGALLALAVLFATAGVTTAAALHALRAPEAFPVEAFLTLLPLTLGFPLLVALTAVAVMTRARSRNTGFAVLAALLFAKQLAQASHTPWHALDPGWLPAPVYSQITGFGSQLPSWWACWGFWVAALLAIAGGTAILFGPRRRRAALLAGGCLLIAVVCGLRAAPLFQREDLLASGLTVQAAADYERRYRALDAAPQPTVTAITSQIDVDAHARRADVRLRYRLTNPGAAPVSALYVDWNPWLDVQFDQQVKVDPAQGFATIPLTPPLAPNESRDIAFTVAVTPATLAHTAIGLIETTATHLRSEVLLPRLGYNADKELIGHDTREQQHLPPASSRQVRAQRAAAGELSLRERPLVCCHFGRVLLDTTLTTAADQTAIAPGRQAESHEDGARRRTRFVTDAPTIPFFAVMAGHWTREVRRSGEVDIEIYFAAAHARNVRKMLDAAQSALTYGEHAFGPYGDAALRIVEVPRQLANPESFPGSMAIPEHVGFGFDLTHPGHDWLRLIIAHETAHQWWAMKVTPADAAGAKVLTESLAQYTALRVMKDEKAWFVSQSRDTYRAARRRAAQPEPPLIQAEAPALVYDKAAVVLDALAARLGEATVNEGLAAFVAAQQGSSEFPLAEDLDRLLRERAGRHAAIVTEAFEGTDPESPLLK